MDPKLFQQFVTSQEKPLKRLLPPPAHRHRAEATVLMRRGAAAREIFGLGRRKK